MAFSGRFYASQAINCSNNHMWLTPNKPTTAIVDSSRLIIAKWRADVFFECADMDVASSLSPLLERRRGDYDQRGSSMR